MHVPSCFLLVAAVPGARWRAIPLALRLVAERGVHATVRVVIHNFVKLVDLPRILTLRAGGR